MTPVSARALLTTDANIYWRMATERDTVEVVYP
jgi:hypothetical protein